MQITRTFRNRLVTAAVFVLMLAPAGVPAHAVSKEIVELQTQVQQLLDMVQRLQSTMDSKFSVLQSLTQQTADAASQMQSTVKDMQQKLNTQNETVNGKLDTTSGQMQSINDSIDELKSRVDKLQQTVKDLQTQVQTLQAPPPTTQPGAQPGQPGQPGDNSQGQPGTQPGPNANAAPQAPPLQETFHAALSDFMAGRFPVAQGEFQDVVHYYPLDDLAGTAQYYLGEIAYQQKDYPTAISAYNAVLEGFSGNPKAPGAQLHKGLALIEEGKKDAGVRELRELIQRHPQTPEARIARSKLNGMGVRITPHA
ncbi:MAG: tetratricopeptide repeat protein [Terracidiphilus sp.]|jgi:tol-pal system protein YbgF